MNARDNADSGVSPPEAEPRQRRRTEIPTSDEARAWLRRTLAQAPERDQAWIDRMLSIYAAGKREAAVAAPSEPR